MLEQTSFSTNSVAPRDRLRFWNERASSIFEDNRFKCTSSGPGGFEASLQAARAGSIDLFQVTASPHRVERRSSDSLSGASLVTCQVEGNCRISQYGKILRLSPGDIAILDASAGMELSFEGPARQSIIRVPRSKRNGWGSQFLRTYAAKIDGSSGQGRIVSSYAQAITREMMTLSESDLTRVVQSLLGLIDLVSLSSAEGLGERSSTYQHQQRSRIRLFIEDNLHDTTLSPALVAQVHNMSVSNLNKLFHASGTTVCKTIMEGRLAKCWRTLADPAAATLSIGEIAYRWGFKSASHFCRSFRGYYGISPSDFRLAKLRTVETSH